MNSRPLDPTQLAQVPGHQRDLEVPQYYVWGTDDSAIQSLCWILDSTRDDLEIAGPMPLETAQVLAEELNAAALTKEPVLVVMAVAPLTPEDDPVRRPKRSTSSPAGRAIVAF